MRRETRGATGDHRSDFNLIAVVQHLVFGDEIIAFDHQMRFDDKIQLAQELFDLLGAFDFDGSGWMAQLDLHERIIIFQAGKGQGVWMRDGIDRVAVWQGKSVAERGKDSIQLLLVTFIPSTSGRRHAERTVQFGAEAPRALGPRCESEPASTAPLPAETSPILPVPPD